MMRTLIIGGGAAGMAAAIAAARAGQAVTVLERGRRPLKKLGVTGNGRGNLLNAGAPDYPGGASFAAQALAAMPYDRLAAFWAVSYTHLDVYKRQAHAAAPREGLSLPQLSHVPLIMREPGSGTRRVVEEVDVYKRQPQIR